jgi:hypothetical protein
MLWSPAYLESGACPARFRPRTAAPCTRVKDVKAYVLSLPHCRSEHLYWQRAHRLLLDQADVVTLRGQVELALFCDAQLDIAAMDTA